MTDFSMPQRMSPGAFVIILLNTFKRMGNLFWLLILPLFINADFDFSDSTLWWQVFAVFGAAVAFALLVALAEYLPKRFHISDGNLIFRHGIIRREITTIPLERIHTLRTRRGIFYRILGLRGVAFDTLASKAEEIELILEEADWRSLLAHIESGEQSSQNVAPEPSQEAPASRELHFSNLNLLRDAFCQNHFKGAAILLGFLALIFDRINEVTDDAASKVVDFAESYIEGISISVLDIAFIAVAVYLLVLLLWLGKVLLKYFNLTLTYNARLLTFSHGLLSRMSSRFAYNKVCTIWVKRNFLERKWHLSTLILRQALNASAMKEEDNLKIYGASDPAFFLKWWLGNDYDLSPELACAKSGRGVLFITLLPDLLLSIGAAAVITICQIYAWLWIPAVYLAVAVPKSVCAMRRSRISLHQSHIVISNGKFADIRNYLKYENVEVVAIRRSPFSRWTRRVTLLLATSGSNFRIRSLKESQALAIYEQLLLRSLQ